MSENKMLIDAAHPEETRVVVLRSGRVEEFDYESAARKQLRGNIYLAKVTRVEPALQAAFIDYGGNRHGFLAFNEVHPDYYQIPMADRLALLEEEAAAEAEEEEEIELAANADEATDDAVEDEEDDEEDDDADDLDEGPFDVHAASDEDEDDEGDHDADEDEVDDDLDGHADEASAATASQESEPSQETAHDEDTPASDHRAAMEAADEVAGQFPANATDDAPASEENQSAGDESAPSEGRSTVLSEAMPRDETLSESPASEAAETPDSRASVSSAAQAEGETATTSQAAPMASESSAPGSGDQPDYYMPVEPSADQSDDSDSETDSDAADRGENRARGRRGRPGSGRRRRGGRSRRGRSRDGDGPEAEAEGVEQVGNEDALEELPSRPRRSRRSYKIQEVIKRRQVLLIQVVKEERGNKGAALTTYLSLAGRYTVLMPNTARGGGISRKITNPQDRKRLKAIANELDVPEGMGLIIRTAGAARTKQEIRRDFEYLLRLWESVRELTLQSTAPALVYEEGDLIKRSIRDLYNKDIDQVVVAGEEAHRCAKNFMRMLMPSHAKNVIHYEDPEPLFTRHGIERQLNAMFSPYVHLPSGGYLVINQTEALVAIDVNSGRSTREFSIEETALNTNLEASDEIARQLKLRDLAGLIVIDYIDMEERRNNRAVERRIREALKDDRARIQIGRISPFGLLEMSRQRLRTGVLEGSTSQCAHCQGTGIIRSVESVALGVLRGLEDAVMAGAKTSLIANTTAEVALYILNNKRDFVIAMEKRLGMPVVIQSSPKMAGANFTIEKGEAVAPVTRAAPKADAVSVDWGFEADESEDVEDEAEGETLAAEQPRRDEEGEDRGRRRRRRRRGRRSDDANGRQADSESEADDASGRFDDADDSEDDDGEETTAAELAEDDSSEEKAGRRRRRGRRGGRRNRGRNRDGDVEARDGDEASAESDEDDSADGEERAASRAEKAAHREPGEPRAANDDEPGSDDEPPVKAESAALAASNSTAATEMAEGAEQRHMEPAASSQADEAAEDEQAAIVEETLTVETASAFSIATEPVDEAEASAHVEVAEAGSDTPAARSPRGEPVSSEPRVARITVSPGGPETDSPKPADSATGEQEQSSEKPARRGWWQRKLLGDA